jgi:hypothetical protein
MEELFPTYWSLFIGRSNDFAQQRPDGGYWRVGRSLTLTDLAQHLEGRWTLGTYVINEVGRCRFAVYDADSDTGLQVLRHLQVTLAHQSIPSCLERSRRGGHLWVFLAEPVPASQVRAWLLPSCPSGVEFYPKQAEGAGYGSLIRFPLGIHLRSGKRYPFVEWRERGPVPVARSVSDTLRWLATVQRVPVPDVQPARPRAPRTQETSLSSSRSLTLPAFQSTIRDWCATQDPYRVIGGYVDLNGRGVGQCPFSWHHAHGDTRPSFKVYSPSIPGGWCWYCYAWQHGGSVFDFLRYWYGLDAREMWKRLQAERNKHG